MSKLGRISLQNNKNVTDLQHGLFLKRTSLPVSFCQAGPVRKKITLQFFSNTVWLSPVVVWEAMELWKVDNGCCLKRLGLDPSNIQMFFHITAKSWKRIRLFLTLARCQRCQKNRLSCADFNCLKFNIFSYYVGLWRANALELSWMRYEEQFLKPKYPISLLQKLIGQLQKSFRSHFFISAFRQIHWNWNVSFPTI